jgi:hypothetical protein
LLLKNNPGYARTSMNLETTDLWVPRGTPVAFVNFFWPVPLRIKLNLLARRERYVEFPQRSYQRFSLFWVCDWSTGCGNGLTPANREKSLISPVDVGISRGFCVSFIAL